VREKGGCCSCRALMFVRPCSAEQGVSLAESMARNEAVRDRLGFGGFTRTDYRSAVKRTLRSACDTDGRTAGRLISCQNFESVADCILSQW